MRLKIVTFGTRLPNWVNDGVAEYLKRLPRDWSLDFIELKPEARNHGRSVAQLLSLEARRIDAATGDAMRVVLDERGQSWTTTELAKHLQNWRAAARDVALIIGSADGVDAEFKARADRLWSLSNLTIPHGIARILVIEQLYRAISLINGHPYHRE
ncbi:MAG: 23S rRNA (pseudouridine(1915)-N(3))-methyltransferase RlmH [Burkholderiales bacterium]|jgi:23S rRNA (pseudouridine1915-N3)-methyltransferase|nr:23S rRNA (pseudouridine(1915)-N(3))-methyltransferase RlmH [Burkholderiales bacterium]